ncbi:Ent-kaurenoic acid oxidase 1-like protein [Drosera capensis]
MEWSRLSPSELGGPFMGNMVHESTQAELKLSFMSSEGVEALEREYTMLNHGVRSMAIDLLGFAYCQAVKAGKRFVAVFQSVLDERKKRGRNLKL